MTPVASGNLYALLRARFPDAPDAVCLEPVADTEGAVSAPPLTYAALDEETARVQAVLAAHGVGAGDRVVVQVEKSVRAIVFYLACLRRGAIYVPLNTAYTAAEVAYFLADAAPTVLVCDPARAAALAPAARSAGVAHVLTLDAAGAGSLADAGRVASDPTVAASAPDDVAAILYTSGTTGRAKGAMLTHANLAANARALHQAWRWQPGDVLLHALPIFHAHGLFVALHCALLNASPILLLARFDAARVLALLARATVFMGVPTHYTRLLAAPALDRAACARMRLFVSGSAPLLAATQRAFTTRTGHEILERYGMTETGMITSNPYDGPRVLGSVGAALAGVETRIVAADGRGCAPDEPGVLEVRGPNVFRGYWRQPERTRAEFRADGFFVTGDLATMAADGRVTLVGRARDLIISGGLNVHPREVEAALDALPGVRESAVIGVPHPDLGEGVTAVVVPDGSQAVTAADVRAALAGRLAGFKQPKQVFVIEALPRNAMGKVQKSMLRTRFAGAYAGS
jgi:malonyl-CoA/methylmalonyl-CoA synthetase